MSELEKDTQLPEDEEMDTDVITLVDEEGVEHEFEIADVLEHENETYMALIPLPENAEEVLDDLGELVILQVITEGEEEFLEAIEEEETFQKISKLFMERLGEEYDFTDEE